MENRWASLK